MHTHLFLFLFCLIDRNANFPLPHFLGGCFGGLVVMATMQSITRRLLLPPPVRVISPTMMSRI